MKCYTCQKADLKPLPKARAFLSLTGLKHNFSDTFEAYMNQIFVFQLQRKIILSRFASYYFLRFLKVRGNGS